jgi:hypothetical protein
VLRFSESESSVTEDMSEGKKRGHVITLEGKKRGHVITLVVANFAAIPLLLNHATQPAN